MCSVQRTDSSSPEPPALQPWPAGSAPAAWHAPPLACTPSLQPAVKGRRFHRRFQPGARGALRPSPAWRFHFDGGISICSADSCIPTRWVEGAGRSAWSQRDTSHLQLKQGSGRGPRGPRTRKEEGLPRTLGSLLTAIKRCPSPRWPSHDLIRKFSTSPPPSRPPVGAASPSRARPSSHSCSLTA